MSSSYLLRRISRFNFRHATALAAVVGGAAVVATGGDNNKDNGNAKRKPTAATANNGDVSSSSTVSAVANNNNTLNIPYLLIGGGTASYFAALTIRARYPDALVLIVGDENQTPYNRVFLSKELWWYGDCERTPRTLTFVGASGRERNVPYEADGYYPRFEELADFEHGAIALMRGVKAVGIEPSAKRVRLADGRRIHYEKCLIATGSKPKNTPTFEGKEAALEDKVIFFKTIDDYQKLHSRLHAIAAASGRAPRVALVGGGLTTTELAHALHRHFNGGGRRGGDGGDKNPTHSKSTSVSSNAGDKRPLSGIELTLVCEEAGVSAALLPSHLSAYSTRQMSAQGTQILTRTRVKSAATTTQKSGRPTLSLGEEEREVELELETEIINGAQKETTKLLCDLVVVALDFEPNSGELLATDEERKEIPVDKKTGAIVADSRMQVADSIWCAGDVCSFVDSALAHRPRRLVQQWQHAEISGRLAGENMTGGEREFFHEASFLSQYGANDLICAVGDVDASGTYELITYIVNGNDDDNDDDGSDKEDRNNNKSGNDDALEPEPLKAVVFYVEPTERRVVGVLLYNVFEPGMAMARRIIRDQRSVADFGELVKLFDVFGEMSSAAMEAEAAAEEEQEEEDAKTTAEERELFGASDGSDGKRTPAPSTAI